MKTTINSYHPIARDQFAVDDSSERQDLARRDGTIRGVMLNTKMANLDRVFGLTKPTEDFFL